MIRTSATTLPGNLDLNNLLGGILNNGGMNPQNNRPRNNNQNTNNQQNTNNSQPTNNNNN